MSTKFVNLVKLCVGTDTVEHLEEWQLNQLRLGQRSSPEHVTRMRPRRADEVLNGGSLYWVFRGYILARQRIRALEKRDCSDGIVRCAIVFYPEIIRTWAVPRRAFQGWRYLEPKDNPPDLSPIEKGGDYIPPELEIRLREIGII